MIIRCLWPPEQGLRRLCDDGMQPFGHGRGLSVRDPGLAAPLPMNIVASIVPSKFRYVFSNRVPGNICPFGARRPNLGGALNYLITSYSNFRVQMAHIWPAY